MKIYKNGGGGGGGPGTDTWTPQGVTTSSLPGTGIPAGTDLGVVPVTVQSTLRQFFYIYVGPTVSITLNPAAGIYEVGTSIATPIISPTTVRHTNPITTLTLSRSGVGLIHTYAPLPGGGAEPPYTDVAGAVTTDTTYTATVGDGTSTGTGPASYTFETKIYHGVDPSVINTGAGIIAAFSGSGVFATSRVVTYTFDASAGAPPNYLYIAYPASYGPASPALPPSTFGGFAFSDFTSTTSPLTNLSGHTENYIILKTNNTYNSAGLIWAIS